MPLPRLYADVILPLPLEATFTYRLPETFSKNVQIGCRLIVPFGPKKFYTAIVHRIHEEAPKGFAIKDALELLDARPIVLPAQLKLWQWIADYYICSTGEVLKAALPSGLKLESESKIVPVEDFIATQPLSQGAQRVLDALTDKGEMTLAELSKATGFPHIQPIINGLLGLQAVQMKEELRRSYKPRTETHIRLHSSQLSEAAMADTFHRLEKKALQMKVLTTYLDLADATSAVVLGNPNLLKEVSKKELQEACGGLASSLGTLIKAGILESYAFETGRLQPKSENPLSINTLGENQQQAFEAINSTFKDKDVCLLHGVTSSGKTEVYIHLIEQALNAGKQVLYLLPEIALTTQITTRLKRAFGSRMGVYHSKFPDAERVEIWQKQLSDTPYDLILGVRSSIFLPFQRLGLVIVDEEHESSYKQQSPAPRYHARNAALVMAAQSGAKTLLGTATPSIETYQLVQQGRYGLVEMLQRYGGVQMPDIEVVDTSELRRKKMMNGSFSPTLLRAIQSSLDEHQQVILFQNRRGFAPMVECRTCGWVPRCPRCDVSLTYHKGLRQMTCHYCGYVTPQPARCPACEEVNLLCKGVGTERLEDELGNLFPTARIARMDLDTTRTRNAYETIIGDFQAHKTDILVGTQMVSKGLDFDHVQVVGIINADAMMNYPDFRSQEHTFQLLSQVAGRAGRRGRQGKVILQTGHPNEPVIGQIVRGDYPTLYNSQLEERKLFLYPPFVRLVTIYIKCRQDALVEQAAQDFATRLRQVFGTRVMGPDRPAIARVQSLHIRKLLLKMEPTASLPLMRQYLRQIQTQFTQDDRFRSVTVYYDVDPQ